MLIMLSTAVTYAGGYRVSLQGQRALAMGHTGVAVVNSAELGFLTLRDLFILKIKLMFPPG